MSDEAVDAPGFLQETEAFFEKLARERNLGTAKGVLQTRRHGTVNALVLFGWHGRLWLTLIFSATDAWLKLEQARLWWYFGDQAEPFDFQKRPGRPMAERSVKEIDELKSAVRRGLDWIKDKSIDEVVGGLLNDDVQMIGRLAEVIADPDNDLPTDIPVDGPGIKDA